MPNPQTGLPDTKPISSFSQNLKRGVFLELPPDDVAEVGTPGYSPSSMEPEGERSAASRGETESQDGEERDTSRTI